MTSYYPNENRNKFHIRRRIDALFRYGPIFIYGKLVIELLLKFIWGDSNTEFKDVDFEGKN